MRGVRIEQSYVRAPGRNRTGTARRHRVLSAACRQMHHRGPAESQRVERCWARTRTALATRRRHRAATLPCATQLGRSYRRRDSNSQPLAPEASASTKLGYGGAPSRSRLMSTVERAAWTAAPGRCCGRKAGESNPSELELVAVFETVCHAKGEPSKSAPASRRAVTSTGFEPATFAVRGRRATSCSTRPCRTRRLPACAEVSAGRSRTHIGPPDRTRTG